MGTLSEAGAWSNAGQYNSGLHADDMVLFLRSWYAQRQAISASWDFGGGFTDIPDAKVQKQRQTRNWRSCYDLYKIYIVLGENKGVSKYYGYGNKTESVKNLKYIAVNLL